MIKRPKPGEDEDDILKMQEEFLQEKNKNHNLQPAAQVTNLRWTPSNKRSNSSNSETRKPSKYAQSKGLKNDSEKRVRIDENASSVMGGILEKNIEDPQESNDTDDVDDKVYYPKVIPSLLGEIVEKNVHVSANCDIPPLPAKGFPVITKWNPNSIVAKKIVHAPKAAKIVMKESLKIDTGTPSTSVTNITQNSPCKTPSNLPLKSNILTSNDAEDIHKENVVILSKLSEQEILAEQQKLMSGLDPKIIEFIKSKRQESLYKKSTPVLDETKLREEKMDTTEDFPEDIEVSDDSLWENDVFSHPEINKWLHFDSLEKDKLEWMKGIEEYKKIKPDEPYEARFDFRGYLLPYLIEYTEKTKSLFHHGEESHRPGYSLSELFELSRSVIAQQRVMALNTIAGVLEYHSVGTYKDIIEIPLSKIFFIVRFAMDENKTIILEPALKALRNLIYNRIDEASLDSIIGIEIGTQQPALENDKSEIDELESKESELIDFHLAEIDIIAALVRSDILQRLYYIFETIKPSFNCIQYSLQILTRLTRDSVETAQKIVNTDHLMKTIIKNFLPISSLNFAFTPQIAYNGKPILAALKLLRVLSYQSKEIGQVLVNKYSILKPISEYISSGIDGTYGIRIQIEAYCLLSNLLLFNLEVNNAMALSPVVLTALYKHVQGTDIISNSSVISVTHAAVVIQFISRLLNCCSMNLDNFKRQVYPLLKDAVLKWMAQLSSLENYTCGHLRLVSAVLDCCKIVLQNERVPIIFLNSSLKGLSSSNGFQEILKNLVPCSNLLSGLENKDLQVASNIKSLGTLVIESNQKILPILGVISPLPFLASLLNLMRLMEDTEVSQNIVSKLTPYLQMFANKIPSLCDNWFTRMEIDFVFSIVKIFVLSKNPNINRDLLFVVSNKLCYILRIDEKYELEFVFNSVVFNKKWFSAERLFNLMSISDTDDFSKVCMSKIEDIRLCYRKIINSNMVFGPNIVIRKWHEPILPRDWIYLPILILYSKSQETELKVSGKHASQVAAQSVAQKDRIIACSLQWILFNELCFPDLLNDISITDRFCRILCVFLCDNSLFLDAQIKMLLQKCVQILFKKRTDLSFDKPLTGLNNFQDFYTQLLEQFQSVSYGDPMFAACILVPISQKHNVKWRKLLWSEYAGCLRALECPEELLCYEIDDYLYPEETDETLIISYFRALSSNLLRKDTLVYRIALHHVTSYKNRKSVIVDN